MCIQWPDFPLKKGIHQAPGTFRSCISGNTTYQRKHPVNWCSGPSHLGHIHVSPIFVRQPFQPSRPRPLNGVAQTPHNENKEHIYWTRWWGSTICCTDNPSKRYHYGYIAPKWIINRGVAPIQRKEKDRAGRHTVGEEPVPQRGRFDYGKVKYQTDRCCRRQICDPTHKCWHVFCWFHLLLASHVQ